MTAKFKLGQKVKVGDREGVVAEASPREGGVLYSVRCPAPPKPDGTPADHEFDTLGCVREDEIAKDK